MEARDPLRELALAMSGDGILQIKNRHSSLKDERRPISFRIVERPSLGQAQTRKNEMPLVNIKLVEGVFNTQQKHEVAAAITDVLLKFERSEAFGEGIWVLSEEPRRSQTASDGFSGKAHAAVSPPIGSPDNVRCKITDRLPLAPPTTLKAFELGMPVTSRSSI
jgi:phenylpyruvate tautomerase PptA (4-oxalocrotonate tautomerase family)